MAYENILNGAPIDWSYWAELTNITPNQAAKLANRIDPLLWLNNQCAYGVIHEDTQRAIRKHEQQLGNQKTKWTLQDLTHYLGDDSPEGMLEQLSNQTNLILLQKIQYLTKSVTLQNGCVKLGLMTVS